ncbi:tRNA (adenosine(37)-N6)-threonylcarbamoyltransferase complex dimerization subunit type 1 TsaB [Rothia nasimurium]|uniref:tRNA (adenosine(37)-N6)-threonylcarbamoyltransferase complex dimerization subunit type 1 TsaB n=1 Tax=Rothia nasimurium TaxID=85336 RepID=UPI001625EBC3|nr:tRNA (adenosine(37)-N6)-threonylcarbamoyltransferase complex dimerization subunit type 1 TsaB [Rothia nasimurium]
MLLLALDSSATASVALGSYEGGTLTLLAHRATTDTRSHAEVMSPFVEQVLAETGYRGNDLDALVAGTGPGPFTGLRAGIVTARTLAFAWGKPLYGLMSLNALAEAAADTARTRGHQKFLVASDARRREIYSAVYELTDTGYTLLEGPTVGSASQTPQLPVYGFGAGLYPRDLASQEDFETLQPDARTLLAAACRLGVENLSQDTSALYLRESDAKVPATRKKALGS